MAFGSKALLERDQPYCGDSAVPEARAPLCKFGTILPNRLLKKGIPMPETDQFRTRLNVESTGCGC
jgi:hypothetical protein